MSYSEGQLKATEFFTTAELAEKLKMNVQVITRKVQSGEIFAYKVGKDWRIPESAVHEWLQQRTNRRGQGNGNGHSVSASTRTQGDRSPVPSESHLIRQDLLEYILAQFEPNRFYSEDELTRTVMRHCDDHAAVRRELLAAQMIERVDGRYRRRAGYTISR